MNVTAIRIAALIPTKAGCAIFLGGDQKLVQFFIDLHIGHAINSHLTGEEFERPLTHDLFTSTMDAMGAELLKVVIYHYEEEVYYAKIYWEVENEIQHKKLLEVDARPSDAIALAVRQKAPLFMDSEIWEAAEDMSDLLIELKAQADDFRGEE